MEVDMQPIPLRATRSSTKRSRSPSSPGQYDRPSKRASSGRDTSMPLAFPPLQTSLASHGLHNPSVARLRQPSQDWVSQTQCMRLASPVSEHSGFSTPITDDGGEVRVDEIMADDSMAADEHAISTSPRPSRLVEQEPSPSPSTPYLCPPNSIYPSQRTTLQPQNPNRLQIPAIQVQAATPSPVLMCAHSPLGSPSLLSSTSGPTFAFEDASMSSPSSAVSSTSEFRAQHQTLPGTPKRQRFTMGPRADCELCRMRVEGHYMHFD
ncbi:hypothetical protein BD413DRAFT_27209 [Trametes elegans]|nr:hypothetical protein BD413DRAFT_27209 [Trametes elegans]